MKKKIKWEDAYLDRVVVLTKPRSVSNAIYPVRRFAMRIWMSDGIYESTGWKLIKRLGAF